MRVAVVSEVTERADRGSVLPAHELWSRVGLLTFALSPGTWSLVRVWRWARVLAMVVGLVALAPGRANALRWSAPFLVDPPSSLTSFNEVGDLACGSPQLCVAVDTDGQSAVTTAPAAGLPWRRIPINRASNFEVLACPSASLCVASDEGKVFASTEPTIAGSWVRQYTARGVSDVLSVACPSPALCFIGGGSGSGRDEILASTDPAGGPSAWHVVYLGESDVALGVGGLSCPSVSLCVGVDDAGRVLTSVDPTGGQAAWTAVPARRGIDGLDAVACPPVFACFAVDDGGALLASAAPLSRALWGVVPIRGEFDLWGISCGGADLCATDDIDGAIYVSRTPTASTPNWTVQRMSDINDIGGVVCPSSVLCFAFDDVGNVLMGSVSGTGPSPPQVRADRPASMTGAGARSIVHTGATIECPPRGPACRVRAVPAVPSVLEEGGPPPHAAGPPFRLMIPSGTRRVLTFTAGRALSRHLRRGKPIAIDLIARAGRGPEVAADLDVTLRRIPSDGATNLG